MNTKFTVKKMDLCLTDVINEVSLSRFEFKEE